MKTKHLITIAALSALFASCSSQPEAYVHEPLPQVPVQTYTAINPLTIEGKDQPTYQNPYPVGTY